MNCRACRGFAAFFALGMMTSLASAADSSKKFDPAKTDDPFADSAKPSGDAKSSDAKAEKPAAKSDEKANAAKKDPLAEAFALPRKFQPTPGQQKELDAIHSKYEQKLRDALQKVDQASNDADKDKLAREALKIHEQIRSAIMSIVNNPSPEAQKAAANAQKQLQKQLRRRYGRYYY
jgi:hypothetical protein